MSTEPQNLNSTEDDNGSDLGLNVGCFASSLIWGMFVGSMMYANISWLVVFAAVYALVLIFAPSAKVRHAVAWTILGVGSWYAFYWCVMAGNEFH